MKQNSLLPWLCVLTAILRNDIVHCKMVIRTSQNFYFPYQLLEVNCTSSVAVEYDFIEININLKQVAAIIFLRSNGTCNIVKSNVALVEECEHECGCTMDGKSVAWVFNVTREDDNFSLGCSATGGPSTLFDTNVIRKAIPVTTMTLSPQGQNNEVTLTVGKNQTFTCTTDSSCPASWIHWYFDNINVTNLAKQVTTSDVTDNTMYISSSTFVYTVKNTDHLNVIYCEAANIDGRPEIRSAEKTLLIEVPVMTLTFTPVGISNALTVVSGDTREFTCTTDSSRPAALIHWYLGGRNVTNNAVPQPPKKDGTKYISSSKLVYTGSIQDNNKVVYCEAVQGMQKMKSANITLLIGYRPDPVDEIKTVCDIANFFVVWRSESNGGNEQFFKVAWQNLQSNILTRSDNVSDPGVGSIVNYWTKMLSPKSYYTINIESTNFYGTVQSNQQVYCNTSGTVVALPVTENTLSFSAGFGSGAALIVAIDIVAIITLIIVKRKCRTPTHGSNAYEQTKVKSRDVTVYNELNEVPKGRQNPTDSGDKTYEDIGVEANQTSNTDNKRKKR